MLRVTPVYGSRFSAEGEAEDPSCTLLEYSGCRCLVNVGWLMTTMRSMEQQQEEPSQHQQFQFPPHDCVLLTDSQLESLGGLPVYYRQQMALAARADPPGSYVPPPIYATFPTVKMGQMTLYDQHAAICMDGGRPPFTLQDIDDVFATIHAIKYAQPIHVQNVLTVQAHRAGHVVGGAFYCLQRRQDETLVVITEKYHMAKERHLDPATLLQHASTPDVLVTRPGGPAFRQFQALKLPPMKVQQAEGHLTEQIMAVLRRDGNVLLPADGAGRVLELVLLLNQHWESKMLQAAYTLVWFAPLCQNVTEFVRAQLEWMAVTLGHQFVNSGGQQHPYQLRAVHLCTSLSELNAVLSGSGNTTNNNTSNPACVVASGVSLEHGPARDVFLKWADNPDNAVIFTDSSQATLRRAAPTSSVAPAADEKGDTVGPTTTTSSTTPLMEHRASSSNIAATAAATMDPDNVVEGGVEEEDDDDEGGGAMVGDALTETTKSPWTTAGQLLSAWAQAKAAKREMDDSVWVDVNVPFKSPLQGAELQAFLAEEEAQRLALQQEAQKRAMLEQVEFAKGQLRLGEEETTTTTAAETTTNNTAAAAAAASKTTTAASRGRPRKKSRFDSALFMKFSKPLHLTFEVREEAPGIGQADSTAKYGIEESVGRSGEVLEDDYGISVQHERFTDIVSGVDPSKFAGGSGRIGEEVMRRGFGYGADKMGKTLPASSKKAHVSEDEEQGDDDELDERALEAVDLSEGNGIIRGRNGRPPTKVSTFPRKVEVLAEVSYIPGLEGRVGAKAARQSVQALRPREVIVLGGTRSGESLSGGENDANGGLVVTDEVSMLADAAKSFATGSKNILTPSNGETVELAVGHAAYGVRLIDTPYQTVEEKQQSESPVTPIEPYEAKLGACTVCLMDTVATGQKVALDGSIVLAPRLPLPTEDTSSVYLSDGEVLLAELRAELIASGMKAEYSADTGYSQLVINGKIIVRKEHPDDTGRMSVEGPLCEDFYTVRSMVCGQFVTL